MSQWLPHYGVRGSGPVLLMIPGGPMDADRFKEIADRLADTYTVVTYDCRGNSRSPMQGSWDDLTVGLFADDAHRLLDVVSPDQADVLSSSGGATYAWISSPGIQAGCARWSRTSGQP